MAKIKWEIDWMKISTSPVNGFNQVVINAGWQCFAFDTGTMTNSCGSVSFEQPSVDGQFIPYDQLTKDVVLNWIWNSGVDKDVIETSLLNHLNIIKNPPEVLVTPPWV